MFKKFLINIVLGFVVRTIKKWGAKVDFALLKKDLDERVRKLVPGELLDDEAVQVLDKALAVAEKVLVGDLVGEVIKLSADGKVKEALEAIKAAIIGQYLPEVLSQDVALNDDHLEKALSLA